MANTCRCSHFTLFSSDNRKLNMPLLTPTRLSSFLSCPPKRYYLRLFTVSIVFTGCNYCSFVRYICDPVWSQVILWFTAVQDPHLSLFVGTHVFDNAFNLATVFDYYPSVSEHPKNGNFDYSSVLSILTRCSLVDFSTFIYWKSPFAT